MKKFLTIIITVLLIVSLVAGCGGQQQPQQQQPQQSQQPQQTAQEELKLKSEYKLTTNVANETVWGQGAVKFAELAKEYTNGKVNIKVYPSAQLVGGDQMRQAEMVQSGAIDFMLNSTINIAPTIPDTNVFSLPFLFPSYEAVDAALASDGAKKLLGAFDKYNMVGLAYGENGFREVTNNVRPIKTPDDMKGIKMRVVTPIYVDIMRALGANPIAMNWGEVFAALQQRTIDGQENPIVGIIIPNKIYEVQKYLTNWHYSYDALILAVNKDVWNSFPADIQEQLQKAANDAMKWEIDLSRQGLEDGIKLLKDNGMEVTDLTPEQIQPFKDKTKDVYKKYAEQIDPEIVKSFEDAVAALK
ncbi:MAG: DctP family TRAP transporter solute-binding subunit [Thermoanaerobacteraceae bacterium]|nr:DctP family TRAP transporter solute-binding subunit [Thermoanaerobacteraceae bacterium]